MHVYRQDRKSTGKTNKSILTLSVANFIRLVMFRRMFITYLGVGGNVFMNAYRFNEFLIIIRNLSKCGTVIFYMKKFLHFMT